MEQILPPGEIIEIPVNGLVTTSYEQDFCIVYPADNPGGDLPALETLEKPDCSCLALNGAAIHVNTAYRLTVEDYLDGLSSRVFNAENCAEGTFESIGGPSTDADGDQMATFGGSGGTSEGNGMGVGPDLNNESDTSGAELTLMTHGLAIALLLVSLS